MIRTMKTERRATRRTRGMSTMEVLAGAALSLAILGVAMSFFTAQQRALRVQTTFTESQNVTRTFLDLLGASFGRRATTRPTSNRAASRAPERSPTRPT